MIVLSAGADGQRLLVLGLSRANIHRLTAGHPIRVTRTTHGQAVPPGLTVGVMFGETERALYDQLREAGLISAETWVEGAPAQPPVPGPTGRYPAGQLHAADRGELKAALTTDREKGRLHIDFGTELSWLSMTAEDGLVFAEGLRKRAQQLLDETRGKTPGEESMS